MEKDYLLLPLKPQSNSEQTLKYQNSELCLLAGEEIMELQSQEESLLTNKSYPGILKEEFNNLIFMDPLLNPQWLK